jgi:hypothetical protein
MDKKESKMGEGIMMYETGETYTVDIDLPYVRVIETKTKKLVGECIRCGKCCQKLEYSYHIANDKHTYTQDCKWLGFIKVDRKDCAVCKIYNRRPVGCATWPRPWSELRPGCGFKWVDKE